VVGEHLHLVQYALTVSSPVFERINDGEEFFVVDIVIDFHRCELS